MMKKPDRFERVVLKKAAPDFLIGTHEALKLLRQEHRWMVRMVNQEYKRTQKESHMQKDVSMKFGLDCQAAMCKIIVTLLKKRAT